MRKIKRNKIVSLLIVFAMVFTLVIPSAAYGEESTPKQGKVTITLENEGADENHLPTIRYKDKDDWHDYTEPFEYQPPETELERIMLNYDAEYCSIRSVTIKTESGKCFTVTPETVKDKDFAISGDNFKGNISYLQIRQGISSEIELWGKTLEEDVEIIFTIEPSLAYAKANFGEKLDNYVEDYSVYTEEQQRQITEIIEWAKSEIKRANSKEAVNGIIQLAQAQIDSVKPLVDKAAEKDAIAAEDAAAAAEKQKLQTSLAQTITVMSQVQGETAVKLSWNAVSGADGYEIYRADGVGGTYKLISTVKDAKAVSYEDKNLIAGTTYLYKVRAYGNLECETLYGKDSNIVSAETATSTAIATKVAAPTKVKAKDGTQKATITWKKVKGANGYKIYRATKKNGKYKAVKTVRKQKTVKYVNKKLKKGKTYYYKIKAYKNVNGKKVYSNYSKAAKVKVR